MYLSLNKANTVYNLQYEYKQLGKIPSLHAAADLVDRDKGANQNRDLMPLFNHQGPRIQLKILFLSYTELITENTVQ
jgi:hypothetical protein